MKKFYKHVATREEAGGFSICLDERPVKTPAKHTLSLPNLALAEAVADEWRTDADAIDPSGMILTRLANSAVDHVSVHRGAVIDEIAGFAETDLLCYRAAEPMELREKQEQRWAPLLTWILKSKGVALRSTDSVVPLNQAQSDLDAVREVVASFDDYGLSGLHMVTSACGSVVLGLATACGEIDGKTAWELSLLDETFQIGHWGEDPEATKRREILWTDIRAAVRFLELLRAAT